MVELSGRSCENMSGKPITLFKCFSGRTEEQKRRCAEKIAEDISEILVCEISSVSVAIKGIDEKTWIEEVRDKNIIK